MQQRAFDENERKNMDVSARRVAGEVNPLRMEVIPLVTRRVAADLRTVQMRSMKLAYVGLLGTEGGGTKPPELG